MLGFWEFGGSYVGFGGGHMLCFRGRMLDSGGRMLMLLFGEQEATAMQLLEAMSTPEEVAAKTPKLTVRAGGRQSWREPSTRTRR